MRFKNEEHENFYKEKMKLVKDPDCYERALIYCLGISEDTREHINRICDFKTGMVKSKCLSEGWIGSGSARVIKMAFNLYCNAMPGIDEDSPNILQECRRYSVEDLFCCSYAPYFWEAIKLRYPEYTDPDRDLYSRLGWKD